MKFISRILIIYLFTIATVYSQGFNIPPKGTQTFNIKDSQQRSQATFLSEAPFENITGISNDVWGHVSFDSKDIESTLQGEVLISVSSLQTGIEARDEHLQSMPWLYAEKFPTIMFRIKEVNTIDLLEDNKISLVVLGEFELRGKTKLIYAQATMNYIQETEITKTIMPGDLIGISAEFEIKLEDFGIQNLMIGKRVANIVEIKVFLTGSNQL